jgi:protein TonB
LPARATTGTSFGGRTVEASDSAIGSNAVPASVGSAGSAAAIPSVSAPAEAGAAASAVDVTPARVLRRVTPVAPAGVPAKTGGFVVVKFSVTENGRVADVEVVESSPAGVFDSAAQAAVRKWTYEPRKENGVPVTSSARARLVFEPAQ